MIFLLDNVAEKDLTNHLCEIRGSHSNTDPECTKKNSGTIVDSK